MAYLVDGHNLIGTGLIPGIHLDQEDDEERLVQWLRARQPNLHSKITVIFDGGIPGGTSLTLSGGGVTAVFAARYRSNADQLILSRVRKAPSASSLTVVTNDTTLGQKSRSLGAKWMRPSEFMVRLRQRRTSPSRRGALKPEPKLSEREVEEWLQLFGGENEGAK